MMISLSNGYVLLESLKEHKQLCCLYQRGITFGLQEYLIHLFNRSHCGHLFNIVLRMSANIFCKTDDATVSVAIETSSCFCLVFLGGNTCSLFMTSTDYP